MNPWKKEQRELQARYEKLPRLVWDSPNKGVRSIGRNAEKRMRRSAHAINRAALVMEYAIRRASGEPVGRAPKVKNGVAPR